MLEELLAEMTGEFPALGEVFVHERDIFLTHSLQIAALPRMERNGKGNMIVLPILQYFVSIYLQANFNQ